jgi:hypothetical protein
MGRQAYGQSAERMEDRPVAKPAIRSLAVDP